MGRLHDITEKAITKKAMTDTVRDWKRSLFVWIALFR